MQVAAVLDWLSSIRKIAGKKLRERPFSDESFDVLVKTGESYPTKARKRDVRAGDDDAPPRAVA
jgi:hypothetical protein